MEFTKLNLSILLFAHSANWIVVGIWLQLFWFGQGSVIGAIVLVWMSLVGIQNAMSIYEGTIGKPNT